MRKRPALEIDLPGCPLQLGTPLKVATKAWRQWGISWQSEKEFQKLVRQSEEAYDLEWASTSSGGLEDIARAAQQAGLGDANKRLNQAVAHEVAELTARRRERLNFVDLGAGSGDTTAAVVLAAPHLVEIGNFHLIDPATASLKDACVKLRDVGLSVGRNLFVHEGKDVEVLKGIEPGSVDFIVATASLHHHAYMAPVFAGIAKVLRRGGWLVIGDWHCTMWLSPARVLGLLDEIEWPEKREQMQELRRRFGGSEAIEDKQSVDLEEADRQIRAFWTNYARTKDPANPFFLLLEGHRPAGEYVAELADYGIRVRRGPVCLMPESALLSVMVLQKE